MEQLLNLILGPLRQPAPPPVGRDGKDAASGDLTAWLEAVAPGDADPAADARHDAAAAADAGSVDEETEDHWISVGSVLEREVWAWTGITGSIAPSVDAAITLGDETPAEGEGIAPSRGATAMLIPLGETTEDGQTGVTESEDAATTELDPRARMAAAGPMQDGDDSASVQGEGGLKGNAATTPAGIEAAARVVQAEGQSLRAPNPDAAPTGESGPAEPGAAEYVQRLDQARQGATTDATPVTSTAARALADAVTAPGDPAFDVAAPGLALSLENAAAESLRGADPVSQGHSARPGEATAQAVARQIGGATLWHRQGEIEIALSPEELGRVRLVVTGGERGATVTVFFDRPDVLDLMRRHPEQLMQDLRDSGFADARLDLRDGSTGQRQRPDNPAPQGEAASPDSVEAPQSLTRTADPAHLAARAAAGDRHLDIRL